MVTEKKFTIDHPEIRKIAREQRLGEIFTINAANEFPTIGSDGIFLVETSRGKFTVKLINEAEKIRERLDYHLKAIEFIPLPEIIGAGQGYIVFNFIEGVTLLHKALNNESDTLLYYEKALLHLLNLWKKTNGRVSQGRNCAEYQKAGKIIAEFLEGKEEYPVIINGQNYNLTIRQVYENTLNKMQNTRLNCLAHGDARLDNIIAQPNGTNGVAFIDLRPGFCWLDDAVLFGWQKGFYFIDFLQSPKIKTKNSFLEIEFAQKPSPFIQASERIATRAIADYAGYSGFPDWQNYYHLTVAVSAICEIAGVQRRKKIGALGRQLPKDIEYFWLAEAIQRFQLSQEN